MATVRADFFLDPAKRLTEQERALMTAMLHCLCRDVADELRAELPKGWTAANDEENADVIDRLTSARLLDEPGLMRLLLRRADEERIATAARARGGRREARTLQGLVSHHHGAVSAAAMALILARGRRRDRFGQCLVAFDDLSPLSAEALVYAIAAAVHRGIASRHGQGDADTALSGAAAGLLARLDHQRSVDFLTAALVRVVDESGALTEDLLLAAAHEGEVALFAEALASRARIPAGAAFTELLSGDASRLMALLRMAGISREASAALLAGVGDLLGIGDPGEAIGVFDRMTDHQAAGARAWLATAPAYRSALEVLGGEHGHRPV